MHDLKFPQSIYNQYMQYNQKLETLLYIEDELFYTPQKSTPPFFDAELYQKFTRDYIHGESPLKWKQNELNKEINDAFHNSFEQQNRIVNTFKGRVEFANHQNVSPDKWVPEWFEKVIELGFENEKLMASILLNSVKEVFFDEALSVSKMTIRDAAMDVCNYLVTVDIKPTEGFKNKIRDSVLSDEEVSFEYIKNVYSAYGSDEITDNLFKTNNIFPSIMKERNIQQYMKDGFIKDIDMLKQKDELNIFLVKSKSIGMTRYLSYLKDNRKSDFASLKLNLPNDPVINTVINNSLKNNKTSFKP